MQRIGKELLYVITIGEFSVPFNENVFLIAIARVAGARVMIKLSEFMQGSAGDREHARGRTAPTRAK